jgi:predicted transcriptional regulator
MKSLLIELDDDMVERIARVARAAAGSDRIHP